MNDVASLGDVCQITMGQAPSGDSYNDQGEGLPLVAGAGDFAGSGLSVKKFTTAPGKVSREGDIILGIRASIGERVWSDRPYCLGRGVAGLRPSEKLDRNYLWHWLGHSADRLKAKGRGATFLQVNRADINEMEIPLPPLDEQRRIAAILDKADDIRTKKRRVVGHLDGLAEAIFLDMFGDPDAALASHSVVRFGDIAELQGGRNLVADDQESVSEFRVLKISAVTTGRFKQSESKALPADYQPPADHLVRTGDLLISRANTSELVGAVAYVEDVPPNLVLPDKIWRFVWHDAESVPLYYRALFRTASVRRRMSQLASGTGGSMKNISKAKLVGLELPRASFAQQREFACRVAALPRPTLSEVDELFASLQTRAFAGRL